MSANNPITASPLSWPAGWPRYSGEYCQSARFSSEGRTNNYGYRTRKKKSINDGAQFILEQLRIMGVDQEDIIISTDLKLRLDGLPYSNQRDPEDPGAAVYWRDRDGNDRVIALDQYDRIADNLYAIGKTLEALRGIERWGGGQILDRAFTGFGALPSPETAGGVDPYSLLGIDPDDNDDTRRLAYRKMLSKHHPDKGGDPAMFDSVKKAGAQIGIGNGKPN